MKKLIIVFVLGICMAGCSSSTLTDRHSPCKDAYFNSICHKDIDSMTTREFEYYKLKSAECEAYLASKEVSGSIENLEAYFITFNALAVVAAVLVIVLKP